MTINVPQDRDSTFEPIVVKKRQKDISDIDSKIISIYAKGMTTRQISDTLMDIYGFEASEGFISDATSKILPQIEEWRNTPLDDVYPVLYIDAIHYSVRDNGTIRKLAVCIILGINLESLPFLQTEIVPITGRACKNVLHARYRTLIIRRKATFADRTGSESGLLQKEPACMPYSDSSHSERRFAGRELFERSINIDIL